MSLGDYRCVVVLSGLAALCLLHASTAQAAQRLIPSQYATIQAGINAAAGGDEVVIAAGTYTGSGNRNIDFAGKAITVRGTNPADPAVVASTVVDCQGSTANRRRGFKFVTNEGPSSVLAGLTIRNGFGPNETYEGDSNSAGGAIYISSASGTTSPTIRDCVIDTCRGDYWGGGIYAWKSSAVIDHCTFRNCSEPDGMGGAIYCNSNGPTITRCTFQGNSAGYGGAIYCLSARSNPGLVLTGCLLAGNTATGAGGAVRIKDCGSPLFRDCTFSGNQGTGQAGAIFATFCDNIAVSNSLLWADAAAAGPEVALETTSSLTVSYSDVQGDQAGIVVPAGCTLTWASGNVAIDPLFADADGPDNNPATWQDNDYHLSSGSPCIDAGDPARVPVAGQYDIDGDARVQGPRIDIGADETAYVARVHNLTLNTWHATIQSAVNAAGSGDEIAANPWTYNENVTIAKVLTLRGSSPADPATVAATIISGTVSLNAAVTFDGLTVTHGNPGLSVGNGSTVSRCIVRDNLGDGIRVQNDTGSATISDCWVSTNGAIGIDGPDNGTMTVERCRVTGNLGGGVSLYGGIFTNTVRNCLIAGNTGPQGGGIAITDTAVVVISNCTIVGNSATSAGGGMYCYASAYFGDRVSLYNCILWGNSAPSGSQLALGSSSSASTDFLTVSYCDVQGGSPGIPVSSPWSFTWGSGNLTGTPSFVDADGPDNNAATWADNDWHLASGSPCVNTGDPGASYVGQTDLDGRPRVQSSRADVGAYESTVLRVHNITQDTWYSGIQDAIGPANPGDVIVANPGTYYEDITINKLLTLRGTNPTDPAIVAATTISGSGTDQVVHIVASNSTFQGFTVTHGTHGVEIPVTATIDHCIVYGNTANGVYLPTDSGGVATVQNCLIRDNTGAGIGCSANSRLAARGCIIGGNQNSGISLGNGLASTIYDCLIVGNTASQGGGIYTRDTTLIVRHCTLASNTATSGGGMYCLSLSYMGDLVEVNQTILWGNTATTGAQFSLDGNSSSPSDTFRTTYCDIQLGYWFGPGNWIIDMKADCISADPKFVRTGGAWSANDYHLQRISPCVDTGSPTFVPVGGETDMDGQARAVHAIVDIGADEFRYLGDINNDGNVDASDLLRLASGWGKRTSQSGFDPACDLNNDGAIDVVDLLCLADTWAAHM